MERDVFERAAVGYADKLATISQACAGYRHSPRGQAQGDMLYEAAVDAVGLPIDGEG